MADLMKRYQTIVLLLVYPIVSVFSQNPATTHQDPTPCDGSRELSYKHPYLKDADSLFYSGKRNQAFGLYEIAAKNFEREKDWEGLIRARNMLSIKYRIENRRDIAIKLLLLNLQAFSKKNDLRPKEEATTLFELGICYDYEIKPDESLKYHNRALNIRKSLFGEHHLDVARSYLAIGQVHLYQYKDNIDAEIFFRKSLEILESIGCERSLDGGNVYYYLGSTYRSQQDYNKAYVYGLKALSVFENLNIDTRNFRTNCYNLLANVSYGRKDYDEALQYNFIAINGLLSEQDMSIQQIIQLANYRNTVARIYAMKKEYDSTSLYLSRALTLYQKLEGFEADISLNYLNTGINYTDRALFDSAYYYLTKSLEMRIELFGEKHPNTSTSLRSMGDLYSEMNDMDSALYYYHRAVVASASEDYNDPNIRSNPYGIAVMDDTSLLLALFQKGSAFKKAYQQNRLIEYLDFALSSFHVAFEIIDRNRQSFELEGSKLFLSEEFYGMFEEALDACFQLYELTENQQYLELAFMTMEKSKARVLYESFERVRQIERIGIPDSVINYENTLKANLEAFNRELTSVKQTQPDDSRVKYLEDQIFQNISKIETLNKTLAANYPAYGNITIDELKSLHDIQKALEQNGSGLLSYFWGDQALYSIYLSNRTSGFLKTPIDPVEDLTRRYLDHLLLGPQFSNKNQKFQEFSIIAHTLGQLLFKGMKNSDVDKLVVVPDGLLRYIPFEALVVEKPQINSYSYKQLKYAIHYYPISYSYSANLWAIEKSHQTQKLRALGFSHSNLKENHQEDKSKSQLPGTAKEIEALKKQLKGLYFSGMEATKQHFIDHAQDYDIIHLAIHGISDSTSHLNNRLLFRSPTEEGVEPMYTHELYNLRLNSRLAVLSACESGIGKNYQGEGVYSMSRAFSYAGCPTTVMSLWRISDKTTPLILEQFYYQIAKGIDVDRALRAAKLTYLNKHSDNMAHPSLWAAMVVHGSTDNIISRPFNFYLLALPILAVVFIVLLVLNRSNKFLSRG